MENEGGIGGTTNYEAEVGRRTVYDARGVSLGTLEVKRQPVNFSSPDKSKLLWKETAVRVSSNDDWLS